MYAIFIDIDGTIIKNNQLICQKDIVWLKKIYNNGCKIIFNTGRNKKGTTAFINKFDLFFDYLVMSNGAQILDKNYKEVYRKSITKEIGENIIEYCKGFDKIKIFIFNGSETIGYYKGNTLIPLNGEFVKTNKIDFNYEYKLLDSYISISLHQDDGKIDILEKIKQFSDDNYDDINVCFNKSNLDINHVMCNKGTGVEKVVELIGDEVITYCIGDDFNDVAMFKSTQNSYTFSFVDKSIADYAQHTVGFVYDVCEDILKDMLYKSEKGE